MKFKVLFFAFLLIVGCKQENQKARVKDNTVSKESINETTGSVYDFEVYDFDGLEKFLKTKDTKVHVVNFWATWCAPCVKELPYFEKLHKEYSGKNVEILLVSLDFPHLYDSKLKPFIKERKLESMVVALDDPDMNTWIPKVDKTWSGAIPATLIYNNSKRKFFEQSFTYSELETELKQFLN